MAQKITHWLIITLILSLGFGQLLRFEYFGLPLYLHDILVITILIFNIKNIIHNTKYIIHKRNLFVLGLSLSWLYALTLYPFSSLLVPSLYTLRILAYLSLYLLLRNTKYIIHNTYFLISGLATLAIGLTQYFLLPDMRWAQYLGWDDHLSRLTLPHFDPTFTAVILTLTFLSIPYIKLKSSIIHNTLYVILVIPAILLSYSRSVWLSLFATLFFFIKSKKILLITICLLLIAVLSLPRRFGEGTNLLRTYSITSRWESDLDYIQKYNFQLLIGRGMNTLVLDQSASQYSNHSTGPNNSYLYLLATTGVLGLVGWGTFMFSLYRHSSHKPMLLFFCISSLFNNVMFYPFALLWVLLIEAMVPTSA